MGLTWYSSQANAVSVQPRERENGMISLQPMTPGHFEQIMRLGMEDYALERARNFDTPIDQERETAARQFAELLPEGLQTDGHFLWLIAEYGGDIVGHVWVYVDRKRGQAFIYNILIDAERRGQGIGKQTLRAVEEQMKRMSVTHIGLNVFADNAVAIGLYQTLGYRTTNFNMRKAIDRDR
jgi:ribosomal protein S18 acetylase RimI-like enzyme